MNNKGFSLPEVLIGVGIMGAVALGSIQLFKSQNDVKKSVDRNNDIQMIQKLVESKLYTEEGCHSVKGLSVGSSISLKIGPNTYSNGSKIGTDQINNFKIAEFIPYDEAGLSGVAKINLSIRSQNGKDTIIQLPLAVNMNGSSIESCNTSLQKITDDLFQNICGGSFGTLSTGKTCSQVLAELQSIISKSICDDVFGNNGQMSGANCNLDIIHANKLCGADSAAVGYDRQGKITCKPVKNSTATPPAVKVCSSWSGWSPAASGACTTATVTQTRSCTSGTTETQTQTVSGTKNCLPLACSSWSDWSPSANTVCSGKTLTQTRSCTSGATENQTQTASGTKTCNELTWGLCFVAGTQVTLADGRSKNIEDLKLGEKVLTYDEVTGRQTLRPIKEVFHHSESFSPLYTITLINGKKLTSNDVHPFYLPDWGRYVSAEDIFYSFQRDPFINLLNANGERMLIANVKKTVESVKLYNIHVNGLYDTKDKEADINHNYYANDILVHNMKAYPDCRQEASLACSQVTKFQWGTPVECKGTEEEKNESLRILEFCKDNGGKP